AIRTSARRSRGGVSVQFSLRTRTSLGGVAIVANVYIPPYEARPHRDRRASVMGRSGHGRSGRSLATAARRAALEDRRDAPDVPLACRRVRDAEAAGGAVVLHEAAELALGPPAPGRASARLPL